MTKPRTTEPTRTQGVIRFEMPDDELAHDHPARVLWLAWGSSICPRFSRAGAARCTAAPHSPRMLLTLWTYAISRGVGSASAIERSRAEHTQLIETRPP